MLFFVCFFFNNTATTEIYTLSLHDALPISFLMFDQSFIKIDCASLIVIAILAFENIYRPHNDGGLTKKRPRSEEHTSELQSLAYLVCRLLLEKKNKLLLLTLY